MTARIIRRAFLAAALALPMAGIAGLAHAAGERFVFVSHAPDSDSWWNTIKNALKNAEHDLGVKVEYRNPSTGDIADMARIIEQATASNPTGIITTIADYNVLESAIKGAIAKGIPVITVNSILTLGPNSADPTINLLRDMGIAGKFKSFISFDLDSDISKAIKEGTMEAAIDQQPYLQGYLPVVFLTEYARYGVIPANNVNTGPGFVSKKNIALVEKLAGEYR